MKISLLTCLMLLNVSAAPMLFDFGTKEDGKDWYIVNDGVMGGRSSSKVKVDKNSLVFKGEVSLENNGGFASLRAPFGSYDLSSYSKVSIRYKASGQVPALSFDKDRRFFIPYYKLQLKNISDEWTTETHDLLDVKEYYLGETTGETLTKELLASIIRVGFVVSNKKAGAFELEVDYIKFE